jgi:hypothetical protein
MNKVIQIISKISIFSLVGVGLNVCLAYTFLMYWTYPQVADIEAIFGLIVLVFFEFVLVHSGVFMSAFGRSWKAWLFLIFFYGVFALAFNAIVNDNQILILYGAVVLNRMLSKILNREKTDNEKELSMSVGYAMIYIVLIVITVFGSGYIPQFGLTENFLEAANYNNIRGGFSGELTDMPHAIMCFGVLYYLAQMLVDVILIISKIKTYDNQIKLSVT